MVINTTIVSCCLVVGCFWPKKWQKVTWASQRLVKLFESTFISFKENLIIKIYTFLFKAFVLEL